VVRPFSRKENEHYGSQEDGEEDSREIHRGEEDSSQEEEIAAAR
jgi:hypothetical protein